MTATHEDGKHALFLELKEGRFDFMDFGCSRGGSIKMGMKLFNAERGLGIDINEKKVETAVAAGHDAIVYDIHKLPNEPLVRFCTMSHFLEHVPDRRDIIAFLQKAAQLSREFIYIQQPCFDADGYLFQKGLKLYWSDWRGHPNAMTTLGFYTILSQMRATGKVGDFSIHLKGQIESSADSALHPINSPRDQQRYDASVHPPKVMDMEFEIPIFSRTIVLITKPGIEHYRPFSKVKFDCTVFDSSRHASN